MKIGNRIIVERRIGEIFRYDNVDLKCTKTDKTEYYSCRDCYFIYIYLNSRSSVDKIAGKCNQDERSDQEFVVFKRI